MHPRLKALCLTPVSFRPRGARDLHGAATFGPASTPVLTHFVYSVDRSEPERKEVVTRNATCYIDTPDWLPATKVGDLMVLPDAQEWVVHSLQARWGETGAIDHWQVTASPVA